jgi:hypothetical protein
MIPVGTVLKSMDDEDIDVVAGKVAHRYQSLARLIQINTFSIVLDSAIIGGPFETQAEREFIRTMASYMLGEAIGNQWVARVEGERAVFGEGQALMVGYPAKEGDRYLLDAVGTFTLFIPLAGGDRRSEGVETLPFDLRISSQLIEIRGSSGDASYYAEVLPRNVIYSSGGPVFKRWTSALFHLGWEPGGAEGKEGESGGAAGTGGETGSDASRQNDTARRSHAIGQFLRHSHAFIGPVIRLEVSFRETPSGASEIAPGRSYPVDLVLPNALIAGDRKLEQVLAKFVKAKPGLFKRQGPDLLIRIGHMFYHPNPTGPSLPDGKELKRYSPFKEFRIPPMGKEGK